MTLSLAEAAPLNVARPDATVSGTRLRWPRRTRTRRRHKHEKRWRHLTRTAPHPPSLCAFLSFFFFFFFWGGGGLLLKGGSVPTKKRSFRLVFSYLCLVFFLFSFSVHLPSRDLQRLVRAVARKLFFFSFRALPVCLCSLRHNPVLETGLDGAQFVLSTPKLSPGFTVPIDGFL